MKGINKKIVSSDKTSSEYLEVNACGIEYLNKQDRGSDRPNGRSDYHILYVEKGTCHLFIDGNWQKANAGSVIIFRPHEAQRYYYLKKDNSISHYVHFTGTGCEHILKKLGIYDIKIFNIGESSSYCKISEQMVREFVVRNPLYKDWCASLLYQLLSLIGRKYSLRQSNITTKSEIRINNACKLIYENINNPPKVEMLAKESFLSVSRFLHLFKEVTGKSYTDFIVFIKMEKAKELLIFTDMHVCDIALYLGYQDQNYFSRHFRKVLGLSPTEYRKYEK